MTTKMVKYLKPGDEVDGKQVEKADKAADGSIAVKFVGARIPLTFGADSCVEVE